MRKRRTLRAMALISLVLGLGLALFAGWRPRAQADGDPLENYNFTGEVPTRDFVHQSRMRVWQHGLWTVQRHVELDPFEGSMWALTGCTFERLNVYFGTRPLWCSQTTYQTHFGTPAFGSHHTEAPRWNLVRNTIDPQWEGDPRELLVLDYTDSGGLTLLCSYWNGGANSGNSAQVIRLVGNRPETAKVEVLWSGRYQDLIDIDGNGEPEIVDSDWAHYWADYLPHKGIWGSVVLDWDEVAGRYALANDRHYAQAMRMRTNDEHRARWEDAIWMDTQRDAVREAVARFEKAEISWDVENRRVEVVLTLASSLMCFLWTGHVDEAKALLEETELPHFGPHERLSRDAWWRNFVAGCRRSDYWKELCEVFPKLEALE